MRASSSAIAYYPVGSSVVKSLIGALTRDGVERLSCGTTRTPLVAVYAGFVMALAASLNDVRSNNAVRRDASSRLNISYLWNASPAESPRRPAASS